MGWLRKLFGTSGASPTGKSRIKGVKVIVESDALSMFGSAMITPPADMIDSIDQELANSGRIKRGEFTEYAIGNGLGVPEVVGGMTDSQRVARFRASFPNDKWACCGRVTQMSRYNVVVAFR